MSTFQALSDFREFYPVDCSFKKMVFEHFRQSAIAFGFEEYDAPVLEPTELFMASSGTEISSQLFDFEDKGGGQVAMRPEMTPSLARMVGSRANTMKRPIKWLNILEVFRYERPQKGRLWSFDQFNADIFGNESSYADSEIIALKIRTLQSFDLAQQDFYVRISNRRLWTLFVKSCGIDHGNISTILGIIDRIERE
jgi:histidyl-tRNA synthetase